MEETAPPVVEPKKKHGLVGRKPNEKQMEGLRKGMEAIKKKREELAKLKEENKEREEKGLEPIPLPPPKPKVKIVPRKPEVIERERKVRADKGVPRMDLKKEFEELKSALKPAAPIVEEKIVEKIVEKPVEKIVEKVVEKTKVLSGSDLLNAIFFNK